MSPALRRAGRALVRGAGASLPALALLLALVSGVRAADREARDLFSPIGVEEDHVHERGDVMLAYRFRHAEDRGLLDGSSEIEADGLLAAGVYEAVPSWMDVQAHVFEAMWAPLEELTFVLSLPYLDKEMQQIARLPDGSRRVFRTRARGLGDFRIAALYHVFENSSARIHLNLGLSLPSGSTNESDLTPLGGPGLQRLPYAMQLGSGTVDLLPGFTYKGHWRDARWGAQIRGVLHAGTNRRGYRLGNRFDLSAWMGYCWASWFGTSFRLGWSQTFGISGEDPLLSSGRSPAEDASLLSGRRLDALFGFDFYAARGFMRGVRFALEAGLPAYQNLDGPQLQRRWSLAMAVQYGF